MAVDGRSSKLYCAANGGHLDYSGNEVDVLDLSVDAPAWAQLLAPTAAGSVTSNTAYYSDGRPSSRHTYYGVTICEANNELMILGGVPYGGTGNATPTVAAFDLGTGSWKAAGTRPNLPTGPDALNAFACVTDPATSDVYAIGNYVVSRWTQSTNTWSERYNTFGPYGFEAMSAFDSTRNRILVIGGIEDVTHLFTLSGDVMSQPTLTGSAASINTQGAAAMVYVPAIDKYLVRLAGSGATVYEINAATWAVATFSTTGGTSIPAVTDSGPYNKFLYVPNLSGCVYVPSYSGNAWFLRTH